MPPAKKPANGAAAVTTVDDYIAGFPPPIRKRLQQVRRTIRKAAPRAEESVAYRIAAYKLDGALVYFAGFDAHIGVYPITPGVRRALGAELAPFTPPRSKGTARFPHDAPLPVALIARIVTARVEENEARIAARAAVRRVPKR